MHQYLMGGNGVEGVQLFSVVPSDRQWVETEAKHFHRNTRKHFSAVRMVDQWNRLSRELVLSSLMETFKTQLAPVLGNLL